MSSEDKSKELESLLKQKVQNLIVRTEISLGDLAVTVKREDLLAFMRILKMDSALGFNLLLDVTCVDWLDSRPNRFEVVYHLLGLSTLHRLRVKVEVPEKDPTVDSLISIWSSANFAEREAWDMYGVKFNGHPDLRRILMYDEFEGYPLRKDYPVQGKQPRIPLRAPEVHNTARDMRRESLVAINKRKDKDSRGVSV